MDWSMRSEEYDHGPDHSQILQVDPNAHVHDVMTARQGLPSDSALLGTIPDTSADTFTPVNHDVMTARQDLYTEVNREIRGRGFLKPLPQIAGKTAFSHDVTPIRSGPAANTLSRDDMAKSKGPLPEKASLRAIEQDWSAKFKEPSTGDSDISRTLSEGTGPYSHDILAIERGLPSERAPLGNIIQANPINVITKPKSEDEFERNFYEAFLRKDLPKCDSEVDIKSLATGALAVQNRIVSQSETFGDTQNDTLATKVHEMDTSEAIPDVSEELYQKKVRGDEVMDSTSVEKPYTFDTDRTNTRYKGLTESNKVVTKVLPTDTCEQLRGIYDGTRQSKLCGPSISISDDSVNSTPIEQSHAYDIDGTITSDEELIKGNKEVANCTNLLKWPPSNVYNLAFGSRECSRDTVYNSDLRISYSESKANVQTELNKGSSAIGDDLITSDRQHLEDETVLNSANCYMFDSNYLNTYMSTWHVGNESFPDSPPDAAIISTQLERTCKESASKDARVCCQTENNSYINADGVLKPVDKRPDAASRQTDNEATCDAISHEHKDVTSQPKPIENEKFRNKTIINSEVNTQTKMFTNNTNHEHDADTVSLQSDIFSDNTSEESNADTQSIQSDLSSDQTSDESDADVQSIQSDIFSDQTNGDNDAIQSAIFRDKTNIECVGNAHTVHSKIITKETHNESYTDSKSINCGTAFSNKTKYGTSTDIDMILPAGQVLTQHGYMELGESCSRDGMHIQRNDAHAHLANNHAPRNEGSKKFEKGNESDVTARPTQARHIYVNTDEQNSKHRENMHGLNTAAEILARRMSVLRSGNNVEHESISKEMMSDIQAQIDKLHKDQMCWGGENQRNAQNSEEASQKDACHVNASVSGVFGNITGIITGDKTTLKRNGNAVEIINAVTSLVDSVANLMNAGKTCRCDNTSTTNVNRMNFTRNEPNVEEYRTNIKSNESTNKLQSQKTNCIKMINKVRTSVGSQTEFTTSNDVFKRNSPSPKGDQTNKWLNKTIYRKVIKDAGISNGTQTDYFAFNDEYKQNPCLSRTYIYNETDENDMDTLKHINCSKTSHGSLNEHQRECNLNDELVKLVDICEEHRRRYGEGPGGVRQQEDRPAIVAENCDVCWHRYGERSCDVRQQEDLTVEAYRTMDEENPGGKVVRNLTPDLPVEPSQSRRVAWVENQNVLVGNWQEPTTAPLQEAEIDAENLETYQKYRVRTPPGDDDDMREHRGVGCGAGKLRQTGHNNNSNKPASRRSKVIRFIRQVFT